MKNAWDAVAAVAAAVLRVRTLELYLHEHEAALLRTERVEDERHSSDRKRLSVGKLRFADEAVDVDFQDEVGVVGVALVAVDVIADARPAFGSHTSAT